MGATRGWLSPASSTRGGWLTRVDFFMGGRSRCSKLERKPVRIEVCGEFPPEGLERRGIELDVDDRRGIAGLGERAAEEIDRRGIARSRPTVAVGPAPAHPAA